MDTKEIVNENMKITHVHLAKEEGTKNDVLGDASLVKGKSGLEIAQQKNWAWGTFFNAPAPLPSIS